MVLSVYISAMNEQHFSHSAESDPIPFMDNKYVT